jgi:hypothetical protein
MTENMKKDLVSYKTNVGSDNIQYKETIKKKLINNSAIIHSLNNQDLDPECPDDFYGEDILPYYLLVDTQTNDKNYICFETSFNEVARYNNIMKLGQVIFYIICNNKDILDKETGIARHDLLAALITDEFDWSNLFGTQVKLVSDRPTAIDAQYVGRTLIFEQTTPNSIVRNGRVINS